MENVMINLYALSYVITHSTIFHSDDVFGVAMLRLIVPGIKIVRTIKPSEEQLADLATGHAMVFDLGCQFGHPEYDHHQADKALRSDGAPYCGFGLLWRDFGHLLCPSNKAWEKVDRELVLPIDKADNGIERSGLADAIYAFNPTWEEGRAAEDAAFWHAEAFAESVLRRYVETANANVKAEEAVLNSQVVEGKVLVLEQYLPWNETVIKQMQNVLFVCYPSARGGWNVQTVPEKLGSFTGRKPFPEKWLGNPDRELGMTFCHPGNFLASTETREQAINVALIAAAE